MGTLILDLCAGSGAWSAPYRDAGYTVERIDLPRDVRLLRYRAERVHGILCAPPCTAFSYARNRYPATDAELRDALSIVDACLRAVVIYRPQWWALENPMNLLRRYLGPPVWHFRQWEYGDPAMKPTLLWGSFTPPLFQAGRKTRAPRWQKSENALPTDAITPPNFARAFCAVNP